VKEQPLFRVVPSHALRRARGERAALRAHGLDYFRAFAAPASGPRNFATMGFDRALLAHLAANQLRGEKWLIGGSAGALRFGALVAGAVSGDDVSEAFQRRFTEMTYRPGDTARTLAPMMTSLIGTVAPASSIDAMLAHPRLRLAIFVASMRSPFAALDDRALQRAFLGFGTANVLAPSLLARFHAPLCFYSGPVPPSFLDDGRMQFARLHRGNLHDVLRATTSIPFMSERVEHIDGVGGGLFCDGGLAHHLLNVRVRGPSWPTLLLGDDASGRVPQTAYDHWLPHRTTPSSFYEHCTLVHPAQAFLHALPVPRVPDLLDWFLDENIEEPARRMEHWRRAFEVSRAAWPADFADLFDVVGAKATPLTRAQGTVRFFRASLGLMRRVRNASSSSSS
jgi:hypothetical protein